VQNTAGSLNVLERIARSSGGRGRGRSTVFRWAATGHRMTTSLDRPAPPSSSAGFQGSDQVQQSKIELIESGAELIRLGPLNREAVAQLATDVLGVEADEELLQKAGRVQANPFLLVEFFRGLEDDLIVSLDSGRATLVEDRLPIA
jgi:hypothetical protein